MHVALLAKRSQELQGHACKRPSSDWHQQKTDKPEKNVFFRCLLECSCQVDSVAQGRMASQASKNVLTGESEHCDLRSWGWEGGREVWCGVVWCGVVWCGVVWCGVVWCGVVWCGVAWRGAARRGAACDLTE